MAHGLAAGMSAVPARTPKSERSVEARGYDRMQFEFAHALHRKLGPKKRGSSPNSQEQPAHLNRL
jgi:hypothetical protein